MLAVALVLVQMLGLAHRIVHAERAQLAGASAFATGADAPTALKSPAHRTGASFLLALFAGHDPGADCDAFLHQACEGLASRFRIGHATLQVETDAAHAHPCGLAAAKVA